MTGVSTIAPFQQVQLRKHSERRATEKRDIWDNVNEKYI